MMKVKYIAPEEKWEISKGDYIGGNDYSKGQSDVRKKKRFVRKIILFFTVSISFLVLLIVLSLLTKFNALK